MVKDHITTAHPSLQSSVSTISSFIFDSRNFKKWHKYTFVQVFFKIHCCECSFHYNNMCVCIHVMNSINQNITSRISFNELTVAIDRELIRRTFSEFLRKPSLNSRISFRVHSTAGINVGSSVNTQTHTCTHTSVLFFETQSTD